jgi:5'-nucleotidase
MWKRKGIEADFTLTNTTGIRDNVYPGPLTIDAMYQIFPFENTISTLFLSGREVIELFDYVARRSALRGCNGQAQIAGARIVITCGECDLSKRPEAWPVPMAGPCAYSVKINDREVIPDMQYSLATNNYIAKGGSGYTMLKKNTTQQDTGITQRDALIDYIRAGKPCGFDKDAGGLKECTTDSDCPSQFTCACDERYSFNIDSASCDDSGNCQNKGLCILSRCAEDLVSATFFGSSCAIMKKDSDINECICKVKKIALNNCLEISCIDANLNAAEDGRIKIIQGVTNYE